MKLHLTERFQNLDQFLHATATSNIVVPEPVPPESRYNQPCYHVCNRQNRIRNSSNFRETQVDKPMIYLYPTQQRKIALSIDFNGRITTLYPNYNAGDCWQVTAFPDGSIIDNINNREYNGLFCEGVPEYQLTIPTGNVVKGKHALSFLENSLFKLGLTSREANEMIIYWLPKMERNPYNLIHFSFDEYTESARLIVTPEPSTTIRVMMVFRALNAPIDIEPQILPDEPPERIGFTLVEWGGQILKKGQIICYCNNSYQLYALEICIRWKIA